MGMEPFLIASSINAAVGQRILRKICPHCKTAYSPPPEVAESMRRILGRLIPENKEIKLFKGAGCKECAGTGYLGRVGIFEALIASPKIMKLILEHASAQQIEDEAVLEGMITLKQDGYMKSLEGVTALEEVLRVAED